MPSEIVTISTPYTICKSDDSVVFTDAWTGIISMISLVIGILSSIVEFFVTSNSSSAGAILGADAFGSKLSTGSAVFLLLLSLF